jgi:hypothetical protein
LWWWTILMRHQPPENFCLLFLFLSRTAYSITDQEKCMLKDVIELWWIVINIHFHFHKDMLSQLLLHYIIWLWCFVSQILRVVENKLLRWMFSLKKDEVTGNEGNYIQRSSTVYTCHLVLLESLIWGYWCVLNMWSTWWKHEICSSTGWNTLLKEIIWENHTQMGVKD